MFCDFEDSIISDMVGGFIVVGSALVLLGEIGGLFLLLLLRGFKRVLGWGDLVRSEMSETGEEDGGIWVLFGLCGGVGK